MLWFLFQIIIIIIIIKPLFNQELQLLRYKI